MDSGARPTGGPRNSPAYNNNTEVVVKIDDKEAAKALREMGPTKLTEKANELIDYLKAGLPVRAARPLRSGDISFTAANEKEAEKLRENAEWGKEYGREGEDRCPSVWGPSTRSAGQWDAANERRETPPEGGNRIHQERKQNPGLRAGIRSGVGGLHT
ncbi:hypothetical protein N7G274_010617 [Stereocaulon virgatum]|uniref:Uncharacterized protein n=1 Tax=Stereocaulon virgatum TaxID=373712 RepID=A0ABR3ZT84_9LECA